MPKKGLNRGSFLNSLPFQSMGNKQIPLDWSLAPAKLQGQAGSLYGFSAAYSYGPNCQGNSVQDLYGFSAVYSYGPKGQGNLAQGLPWVGQKSVFSHEGAAGRNATITIGKQYRTAPSGPIRLGNLTKGKPWAKFPWPFGPQRSRPKTCGSLSSDIRLFQTLDQEI
jgi:hypothetical protein